MSKHTTEYLHDNTRVGFGVVAWWFSKAVEAVRTAAGKPASHYAGSVPLAEVRNLFGSVVVTEGEMNVTYSDAEGNRQVVRDETRKVILNGATGDVFGVFKKGADFRDFNSDLTDAVSGMVGGIGDLGIESCGLLDFGARAYLTVGIPESMHDEKSGVTYRPRLLAATALDGTLATTYSRVVQLSVCDNTLAAALSENGEKFKIKHTKNSGLKIANATQALAILQSTTDEFAEELHVLCETEVSEKAFNAFLDTIAPIPADGSKHAVTHATNKQDAMRLLYKNDNRVSPWAGTALGVLQMVNTYGQHVAIRRGVGDGDASALRAERNTLDAITGKSQARDVETVETLYKVLASV